MNIQLKYKADEAYEAINDSGNLLPIDMLPLGDKQAFSPMQLLLSGVVACAAVDIVSMVKKKRRTFIDLDAQASGERKETHPRGFNKIHINYVVTSPDLTDQELAKIVDLAVDKYCSVADSVNKDVELTHGYEVKRP